jgi:hypothetical protein
MAGNTPYFGNISQNSNFFTSWGGNFVQQASNPTTTDIISAGVSVLSFGFSRAVGAVSESTQLANELYAPVDLFNNTPGMLISAISSFGGSSTTTSCASTFFKELGAGALAAIAGGIAGAAAVSVVGAATVSAPALFAAGAFATVLGGWEVDRLATSFVDTANQWLSQNLGSTTTDPTTGDTTTTFTDGSTREVAGSQVIYSQPSGPTTTVNADGSYATVQNGNAYYYDASGNMTSAMLQIGPTSFATIYYGPNGTFDIPDGNGGTAASGTVSTNPIGSQNFSITGPSGTRSGTLNLNDGNVAISTDDGTNTTITGSSTGLNVSSENNGITNNSSIDLLGNTTTTITNSNGQIVDTALTTINSDGSVTETNSNTVTGTNISTIASSDGNSATSTVTDSTGDVTKIGFITGGTGQTVDAGQSGVNMLIDTTGSGGNT